MAEEQKNTNEEKMWKDVNLTSDFPLGSLVQFLNILNQRLCTIEDMITIKKDDGTEVSLSQQYVLDAKAAREKEAKDAAENAKKDN